MNMTWNKICTEFVIVKRMKQYIKLTLQWRAYTQKIFIIQSKQRYSCVVPFKTLRIPIHSIGVYTHFNSYFVRLWKSDWIITFPTETSQNKAPGKTF